MFIDSFTQEKRPRRSPWPKVSRPWIYFLPLTFCVNAEAATVFTLAGVLGFDNSLEAAVATFDEVVSLFAFVAILAPTDRYRGGLACTKREP